MDFDKQINKIWFWKHSLRFLIRWHWRLALRLQAHPEKVSVEPRAGRIPNERDLTRGVGTKNVLARPKKNKYHGTSYLRLKLISCPAAGSPIIWFSCEPFHRPDCRSYPSYWGLSHSYWHVALLLSLSWIRTGHSWVNILDWNDMHGEHVWVKRMGCTQLQIGIILRLGWKVSGEKG